MGVYLACAVNTEVTSHLLCLFAQKILSAVFDKNMSFRATL